MVDHFGQKGHWAAMTVCSEKVYEKTITEGRGPGSKAGEGDTGFSGEGLVSAVYKDACGVDFVDANIRMAADNI